MPNANLKAAEAEATWRAIQAGSTVVRVTIGSFVRDMRLAARLSQTEVAKNVGGQLAQVKVSQIEIGKFNGKPELLEQVLTYLAKLPENQRNANIKAAKAKHMAGLYFAAGKM